MPNNPPSDIDLAPGHKIGLMATSPLLLSPVAAGFGDPLPHGLKLTEVGALVVGPVSAAGRGYRGPATLVEIDGGLLVQSSDFSRSARRAVERYGATWQRLARPVIVHLVDATAADLMQSARVLARAPGVSGVEWNLPPSVTPALVANGVRALAQVFDAPIWVKTPLFDALPLAERAVMAGAVGVVIGQPPIGAAVHIDPTTGQPTPIHGALYGPATFPMQLQVLRNIAAANLGCALIACGGVHHAGHVAQALAAGACAVQVDSAWWRAGRGALT